MSHLVRWIDPDSSHPSRDAEGVLPPRHARVAVPALRLVLTSLRGSEGGECEWYVRVGVGARGRVRVRDRFRDRVLVAQIARGLQVPQEEFFHAHMQFSRFSFSFPTILTHPQYTSYMHTLFAHIRSTLRLLLLPAANNFTAAVTTVTLLPI